MCSLVVHAFTNNAKLNPIHNIYWSMDWNYSWIFFCSYDMLSKYPKVQSFGYILLCDSQHKSKYTYKRYALHQHHRRHRIYRNRPLNLWTKNELLNFCTIGILVSILSFNWFAGNNQMLMFQTVYVLYLDRSHTHV